MAEIYYVCPKCGSYQFMSSNVYRLSNRIEIIDKLCSYCNTEKVLINVNQKFYYKNEFENHILNTYLKNYPQFDENLYLERISKEQSK